jgi:hypothetical protein
MVDSEQATAACGASLIRITPILLSTNVKKVHGGASLAFAAEKWRRRNSLVSE